MHFGIAWRWSEIIFRAKMFACERDDKILNLNKKLNASKLRFDIDGDEKAIEKSKIQRIALESQMILRRKKFQKRHGAKEADGGNMRTLLSNWIIWGENQGHNDSGGSARF